MLLSADQKRAVARIDARVGTKIKRGTGFLVSGDGLVLTAFHTVGDLVTTARADAPIPLRFGDPTEGATIDTSARFEGAHYSASDDWALLRCDPVPAGVTPLQVGPIRPRYDIPCATYGFPAAQPHIGMVYGGKIRAIGRALQVFLDEATAAEPARIAGLSGGPCIVDGFVVGVIKTANAVRLPTGEAEVREGTTFAVPLELIARTCDLLKMPARPAFVAEVLRLLRPAQNLIRHAAEKLGLPSPATVPEEALYERVAEEMMRRGIEDTEGALSTMVVGLPVKEARTILDLAATTWIHERAAEKIASAFVAPPSGAPVCINAREPDTAERYVHLAGYPTARHPGWKKHVCRVAGVLPEDVGAGLVAEIRRLAAASIGCDMEDLDEELLAHRHADKPIVMVLPCPPPPRSALDAVRAALPQIRLAILVGPTVDAQTRALYKAAGIELVEPMIAPDEENNALRAHRRALRSLEKSYETA